MTLDGPEEFRLVESYQDHDAVLSAQKKGCKASL